MNSDLKLQLHKLNKVAMYTMYSYHAFICMLATCPIIGM